MYFNGILVTIWIFKWLIKWYDIKVGNFTTSQTMYSLGLGNNLWPLEVDKECVWHEFEVLWEDTKDEGSKEGESNLKTKVGFVLADVLLEFKPILGWPNIRRFGSKVW